MALENDPSRKIQQRSRGDLGFPGSCACCGGSDPERTYVDFGIWYDYEGSVYICSTCFTEAVQVMGFFTPEEVQETFDQLNAMLRENAQLKKELEDARPILNAVANLGGSLVAPVSGDSDSNSDLDAEEADSGSSGTDEDAVSGESEVKESPVSEGRGDTSGTKPRNRGPAIVK